jgi:hypothetical protein
MLANPDVGPAESSFMKGLDASAFDNPQGKVLTCQLSLRQRLISEAIPDIQETPDVVGS